MWLIIVLIIVAVIVVIAKKSADNAKAEQIKREERQRPINEFVAVLPNLSMDVLLNQRKQVQEIYNKLYDCKMRGAIQTKEVWINPGSADLLSSLDIETSRTVLKILNDEIKKRESR